MLNDTYNPDATLVDQLFHRQLEVGLHRGAQLAVYHDGDLVIDLAGGDADPSGEPMSTTRRNLLFSCSKVFVATCIHQLVERDRLGYNDPIVDYWPGFAAGDSRKKSVTVRHILTHRSGIPTGPLDSNPSKWTDWDTIVQELEALELVTEPGSTVAYHPLNFGWMLGELLRRVTGTCLGKYATENIFSPLGMTKTAYGGSDKRIDDVATLDGFHTFDRCRDPSEGISGSEPGDSAALFNDPTVRNSHCPAANFVGTAQDLARFFACLGNGGKFDNTRILDSTTVQEATRVVCETQSDGTLSRPMRYTMGFWRGGSVSDSFGVCPRPWIFGHVGLGSTIGWADPRHDLAFAYVTNGIREESHEHSTRVNSLIEAVYEEVISP
jgi:CubicO group peptidase (beta-lactamase class C family)